MGGNLGGNIKESLLYCIYQLMFMPGPTTAKVFPLFPTLMGLLTKGAAPYPHVIATSAIYNSYSPCISSKGEIGRIMEKKETAG
jgi:hypothetical protein